MEKTEAASPRYMTIFPLNKKTTNAIILEERFASFIVPEAFATGSFATPVYKISRNVPVPPDYHAWDNTEGLVVIHSCADAKPKHFSQSS